ncbi:MAG: tyrosine-type recombinase/integrase [Candidatus Acidiferrales bacterium]
MDIPIHRLTSFTTNALVAQWKKNYAPSTAWNLRRVLRKFLEYLEAAGGSAEPRHNLITLRKPAPRTTTVTDEQRTKLLDAAEPWLRCFILLCSQLALRRAEALRVSPRMYDTEKQTVTVPTKGGQTITLPITDELRELFELAPDTDDTETPYIWKLRGGTLRPDTIHRHFRRLVKKAGIEAPLIPHDFRRAAANKMYELSGDIRAVQQLLGHSDLASTAWYLQHRDPEKLRPLVQQLARWRHFKPNKEEPVQ